MICLVTTDPCDHLQGENRSILENVHDPEDVPYDKALEYCFRNQSLEEVM